MTEQNQYHNFKTIKVYDFFKITGSGTNSHGLTRLKGLFNGSVTLEYKLNGNLLSNRRQKRLPSDCIKFSDLM